MRSQPVDEGAVVASNLRKEAGAMPIRYSIDPIHQRLLTHADGVVTFHDINAHLDEEQRNRDLTRAELVDARGATTDLTADQVRRLVQRAASMLRDVQLGPTAIVTSNDVLFGMARMYSILADGVGANAEAFREMASAIKWLDSQRPTAH
jgi:hypothetical protein